MDARTIARQWAQGRVGFGLLLAAAPGLVSRHWLGEESTGTIVAAACLGGRDAVLGAGLLRALSSGDPRPWLVASAAADAVDAVVMLRARDRLKPVSVALTVAVAGGSAVMGAWLSAQDDW